jgi:LmbE family N-acetylglucosaminyl deacetylase
MMEKDIYMMVVSPHPDDAEFGVAGTVARLAREGKEVVYVICTNGDKGTSDRSVKPADLAKTREKEQLDAAGLLGVTDVEFMRLPDQGLEDTPEFRKALVRLIRRYRPEVVVTVNPYRKYMLHRDHRVTGQVVLDAVFPYARDHLAYPDLLEEGLEPHKVREVWLWGADDANHFSDIEDTFDIKINALGCHKSQVGDVPREMRERLRDFARMMAETQDYELGEAFHCIQMRY